jgi:acetylornithine deacetylase/succinyl-diaminopimelate desuccinylase-like protein
MKSVVLEDSVDIRQVKAWVANRGPELLADLQRLCRQPSIATQRIGLAEGAAICRELLESRGAEVTTIETPVAPMVVGELPGPPGSPRLLLYGHYDHVPPEPLDAWTHPPYAASIVDGHLYARGVGDHRSSFTQRLHAADALRALTGGLPLSLVFLMEGEEEIGSPHLREAVRQTRSRLAADAALYGGGSRDEAGHLMVRCGKKGNLALTLKCRVARLDSTTDRALIVPDAAWRLIWALSTIQGPDRRIRLSGFYDDVAPIGDADRAALARIPFPAAGIRQRLGLDQFLDGVDDREAALRETFAPALTICTLAGGFPGPGFKPVLPAEALAHLEFQLAEGQDPDRITKSLREHLDTHGFSDVTIEVIGSLRASRTPVDAPVVRAAVEAARATLGQDPLIYPLTGGAGPWDILVSELGIPMVSDPGVRHAGSNDHAPDENIRVDDYLDGVVYMTDLFARFARESPAAASR